MDDEKSLVAELKDLRQALVDASDSAQETRLRLAIESRERELAARRNQRPPKWHRYPSPKGGPQR